MKNDAIKLFNKKDKKFFELSLILNFSKSLFRPYMHTKSSQY